MAHVCGEDVYEEIGSVLRALSLSKNEEEKAAIVQQIKSLSADESQHASLALCGLHQKIISLMKHETNDSLLSDYSEILANLSGETAKKRGVGLIKLPSQANRDLEVEIEEIDYSLGGLGWKIWDSAKLLAKYVWDHPALVSHQAVLELGAGTGLVGIATGRVSPPPHSLVLTDFHTEMVECLKRNVQRNHLSEHTTFVRQFDWAEVKTNPPTPGPPLDDSPPTGRSIAVPQYDVILGADVVYQLDHSVLVPVVLHTLLSPGGQVFLTCKHQREGFPDFLVEMDRLGFVTDGPFCPFSANVFQ